MSVGTGFEDFRPGDSILLPFLILAQTSIVNLSAGTIGAELWVRQRLIRTLSQGDGISIVNLAPLPAAGDEAQDPHGIIEIPPEVTDLLPIGPLSKLSVVCVIATGKRLHAPLIILRGVE